MHYSSLHKLHLKAFETILATSTATKTNHKQSRFSFFFLLLLFFGLFAHRMYLHQTEAVIAKSKLNLKESHPPALISFDLVCVAVVEISIKQSQLEITTVLVVIFLIIWISVSTNRRYSFVFLMCDNFYFYCSWTDFTILSSHSSIYNLDLWSWWVGAVMLASRFELFLLSVCF